MVKISKATLQQLALQMQILDKQEQRSHVGGSTSAYSRFGFDERKELSALENDLFSPQVGDSREFLERGAFDTFGEPVKEQSSMLAPQEIISTFSYTSSMSAVSSGMTSSDYSGSFTGFLDLNKDEQLFVLKHPGLARQFRENAKEALKMTQDLPGRWNGYGDAIRHCYWSALNQMDAGFNSKYAKEFGDAHESSPDNNIYEKNMDLHNNSVGYLLGNRAIRERWSKRKLYEMVEQYAMSGALKTTLY